ncbi:MAG: S-layer homology domain-containing protein [Candidatus Gracilibacteria bacterium]|jgi:flagellar hook assembly protein FlgD
MTSIVKKLLSVILGLTLCLNAITPVYALGQSTSPILEIKNTLVSPNPVNFRKDAFTTITYTLTAQANVTLRIYKQTSQDNYSKIGTYINNVPQNAGSFSYKWDGKLGADTLIGTAGEMVETGTYYYGLTAESTDSTMVAPYNSAYKSEWINVDNKVTPPADRLEFVDVEIEDGVFNPYGGETTDINFTINKDAYITLEIEDEDENRVDYLAQNELYTKGTNSIEWDGENKWNDLVEQGFYTFKISAVSKDGNEEAAERGEIEVKKDYSYSDSTSAPKAKNIYVTKEEFDSARESTYIVFETLSDADIEVNVYDDTNKKLEEIYDKNNAQKGVQIVEWDGASTRGVEGFYSYEIKLKNNRGEAKYTGELVVKEDDQPSNRANVLRDTTNVEAIPFDISETSIELSFRLDKTADVLVEIMDGGFLVKELKDEEMPAGLNTINWDGRDDNGDSTAEGIYSYKITARNERGKDEEVGYFSIIGATEAKFGALCGGFKDVEDSFKYCEAIQWAKDNDIFKGYEDGNFKPNQPISRVEVLKVILEALDVNTVASSGDNFGFPDVARYEWYTPYLKTALLLGIVRGYTDGTFKPGRSVTRAEAIKILLETGRAKNNVIIPTAPFVQPYYDTPVNEWYLNYVWMAKDYDLTDAGSYFYPNSPMTRGEVADMLYRYHQAGLDS